MGKSPVVSGSSSKLPSLQRGQNCTCPHLQGLQHPSSPTLLPLSVNLFCFIGIFINSSFWDAEAKNTARRRMHASRNPYLHSINWVVFMSFPRPARVTPLLNSKCAYGSILDSQDGQHSLKETHWVMKEVILFRLLQEEGHSWRQKDIAEKRQKGLGFYKSERVGRTVDNRSHLKGRMDLIWSGVGLIWRVGWE